MAAKFKPVCPYCDNTADNVGGDVIYPHRKDLAYKKFWHCAPCSAWVGCFQDGSPLGTLANQPLRQLRIQAHRAFDPLWGGEEKVFPDRDSAYTWLGNQMQLPFEHTHFAMFTESQCAEAISIVTKFIKEH